MYDIRPDPVRYVKFLRSDGAPQAIAVLRLEYEAGPSEQLVTDPTWRVSSGPITFDNIFAGEDYDARLEQAGWDRPGFRAGESWLPARPTAGPGGTLRGLTHSAPPIGKIQSLPPAKVTLLRPGVFVYDLGQNASVMPQLKVHGPRGSTVRIIPSELLADNGEVDRASCTQDGVRPAWWQYTLNGKGQEAWFPKFFYQGSRYFQVELRPATDQQSLPTVERLDGVVVHSTSDPIGTFTTSHELFNRIFSLVRWAERSNMMSLMTDCPHRERLGWLEETQLNGPSLRYNFDMAPLMAKVENDIIDSQLTNGFVPNIAPEYFIASTQRMTDPFRNSPEWGSAFILVPWQQYQFSGDPSLLREHYEAMKRYVAFLASTAKDDIIPTGLGDWYDVGPKPAWGSQLTPVTFTATAFYYYDNWVMAQTAKLLNRPDDAKKFTDDAQRIQKSFNRTFFDPATNIYSTGSQTCCAMPLVMGLVDGDRRSLVVDALVADIRKHGNALTTGEIGYPYLLRALAQAGRSDIIFAINNQSDKPGYGYQLKHGATSLTEKWDGSVGSFGSQDHFMSGEIIEWFYGGLVGIQPDPDGPGFKKIIIKPTPVGDIKSVKGTYDSAQGKIESEWTRANGVMHLNVTIPANTTATVYMPTTRGAAVTEAGKPAATAVGVHFLSSNNDYAIFAVTSGTYSFRSPYSNPLVDK